MNEDRLSLSVSGFSNPPGARRLRGRSALGSSPWFEFLEIRGHAQGGQRHQVAFFTVWHRVRPYPRRRPSSGYDPAHSACRDRRRGKVINLATGLGPARGPAEYRFKVPGPDGDREHVQVVPAARDAAAGGLHPGVLDAATSGADRAVPARGRRRPSRASATSSRATRTSIPRWPTRCSPGSGAA